MFYRELQRYTDALQKGATQHDSNFDDVKAALAQFPDLKIEIDSGNVGAASREVKLLVSNPHGEFQLRYRYSRDFFLTLMCHVTIDGRRLPVRWWDDYSKFEYADEEHRQTVYDFMRAVNNGF